MSAVTAGVGAFVGAAAGYLYCSSDDAVPNTDAIPKTDCPDDDNDPCGIQLENDYSVCRMLSSPAARARCWASASERYEELPSQKTNSRVDYMVMGEHL